MKTVLLSISMLLASSLVFATEGKKEGETSGKSDSTEVKKVEEQTETSFEVLIENGQVAVKVNGNFDPYASVSLATNRGSDIYFNFLQDGSNAFTFDISQLESGSYYVILNSKEEVRIKRFQK